MKIMIVEDDLVLAKELFLLCERWGFQAVSIEAFAHVDLEYQKLLPDLILMDINLPYFDGFYWCERIRALSTVPVLFLSSREQKADKMMAMAAGGDDYIEKPFDTELLLIKIRSMLRRTYEYQKNEREYLQADVFFDGTNGIFGAGGKTVDLTKSENKILSVLISHRGNVVDREKLMMQLWNTDEFVTDASLTVLVSRLRSKIREINEGNEIIGTKKGKGYFIE